MVIDRYEQVLEELAQKDFLIYALKSAKQLKREYKELDDHEEFQALSSAELVFVWWFAVRCSPILELPEEKRVLVACDKAFKSKGQAEARKIEYSTLRFPDHIKNAIKVMDRFDPGGRIQRMADDLHLLKQMQIIIRKDISGATPDEIVDWMKIVVPARKVYDEILLRIERGGLGVEETSNVMSASLEGVSSDFMKQQIT